MRSGALMDSCAVIGNGPVGSDLSAEIDNSYVMRCNTPLMQKGTGTEIDLNITSLYNFVTGRFKYPILGVFPISDTAYQDYVTVKDMHVHWNNNAQHLISKGNNVWLYNERDEYCKVFKSLAKEINAFPTTGMMGIATARWIGFKRIILSGFTFFQLGFTKPIAAHHNPDAEAMLIKEWIKDGEYLLDEETKKALYDNEKN
jgi:hypothetical protein